MKFALISPNEQAHEGWRVAQVEEKKFDVADPLFWVECEDAVTAEDYFFSKEIQAILQIPIPVVETFTTTEQQTA